MELETIAMGGFAVSILYKYHIPGFMYTPLSGKKECRSFISIIFSRIRRKRGKFYGNMCRSFISIIFSKSVTNTLWMKSWCRSFISIIFSNKYFVIPFDESLVSILYKYHIFLPGGVATPFQRYVSILYKYHIFRYVPNFIGNAQTVSILYKYHIFLERNGKVITLTKCRSFISIIFSFSDLSFFLGSLACVDPL